MTTYSQQATRSLLLALSAAAVASTLTAAPAAASGAAGTPALDWKPCVREDGPTGQECAELPVPLDYRDPDGRQLTLAVSRVPGDRPQARRGTLLVIPGGPGGSGVRRLTQKGTALREATGGAYDIVSFDPRGVGASTRANCGLDEGDRHLVTLRGWPGPKGEIGENVARARRVADACARNGGDELRSFTTANEVRDIDRFRRALGEEKLSAWALSYGTYVAAVYAQKYPRHTDRWVLDSSGDPDPARVARGWLANMSAGADGRFPDFAAWAADPAREARGLRLARRPQDVRPLVLGLAARLDREPRPSDRPGTPLTGNRLRQALQNALTSDGAFPQIAALIKQALDPDAEVVLTPDIATALSDEDAAVTVGVICNDVRWSGPAPAPYQRAVLADRARYPLTAGMPVNVTPCSFWKGAPVEKPTRITGRGPSSILMVQSLRDSATPYFGGLRMREALGDRARLVTAEHGGHVVYLGNGNACGDRAVSTFLTTGERPARDTYCAD
ncbi:alpha/beta hydrolase [Streptomyces chryseus]|uniref:alpha/beta hydrolase n=1 Tax=Streptomyces chryseus TaxID=68186 RepID=UPI00110FA2C5|nr:alpha/beta hydrolase [Streptomyces chryseus]